MSITELLYLFLNFVKRFWWVLVIIMIPYSCRTYTAIGLKTPLKKDIKQVVDIAVDWWHLPEAKGGGGMRPLPEIGVNSLRDSTLFASIDAFVGTYKGDKPKAPNEIVFVYINNKHGSYTIEIIPNKPNHVTIHGHILGSRLSNTVVAYKIYEIDLSQRNQNPKIKWKSGWRIWFYSGELRP